MTQRVGFVCVILSIGLALHYHSSYSSELPSWYESLTTTFSPSSLYKWFTGTKEEPKITEEPQKTTPTKLSTPEEQEAVSTEESILQEIAEKPYLETEQEQELFKKQLETSFNETIDSTLLNILASKKTDETGSAHATAEAVTALKKISEEALAIALERTKGITDKALIKEIIEQETQTALNATLEKYKDVLDGETLNIIEDMLDDKIYLAIQTADAPTTTKELDRGTTDDTSSISSTTFEEEDEPILDDEPSEEPTDEDEEEIMNEETFDEAELTTNKPIAKESTTKATHQYNPKAIAARQLLIRSHVP